MSKHSKTLSSGLVVMILVAASYVFAIRAEMHLFSFEPRPVHQLAISAAISRLKYRLPGYLGYRTVFKALDRSFDNIDDSYYPVVGNLNPYITNALKLQNVAHDETHTLRGQFSPALVDYYSLSFLLFGYQFQSLLYFYFLLLAIQSLIFFVQFRHTDNIIAMLILFLIAHYMTLTALRFPGNQLDAPNNYRFLPVLAILPMLHLCLLSLYQRKVTTPCVLGAVAQSLLLAFIIQCRSSALGTGSNCMCGCVATIFAGPKAGTASLGTNQCACCAALVGAQLCHILVASLVSVRYGLFDGVVLSLTAGCGVFRRSQCGGASVLEQCVYWACIASGHSVGIYRHGSR